MNKAPKLSPRTLSRPLLAMVGSLRLGGSAALAQEVNVEPMDKTSEAFVSLFSSTCVKYYRSPEKLVEEMGTKGAPELEADKSGVYLHDQPGKAWVVSDGHGAFVVALRESGACSVFAQRAKEVDVQMMFASLVTSIKVPDATMIKVADKRSDTPQGPSHYVAYAQDRKTPGPYARFGLTTTSSESASFQALATLSMAIKQ